MVLSANPRPFDFYPTTLVQIVTRGQTHNLGPIAGLNAYRFYFDGLIAYMHSGYRGKDMENAVSAVGVSSKMVVLTQTFERSVQRINLIKHVKGILEWPEVVEKLVAPRQPNKR
jgi:hypothetical protein